MIDVDIEQPLGTFHLAVRFAAEAPVLGLFGRSGSGKTSVVNAIAGITTPRAGWIRINGTQLFDASRGIDVPLDKRRVGYVFQDALLFPHIDVESNLHYGQRLRPHADRFIDEDRVVDLLALRPLLRRKPHSLSGGEKQRVAIGRALLAQPRILLMDEPLAALDVARRSEILDYVERLRDEVHIPIVYVSHSVAEISRIADSVVVLDDGRCVAFGPVDDVLARPELTPAPERYEAGVTLDAVVAAHDTEDQLTTLDFEGGCLLVPRTRASIGERTRVRIRARDVALSIRRPADISVLNVLPARVIVAEPREGAYVDVRLGVGGVTIVARITRRSFHQLGIHAGQQLFALVKAVSVARDPTQ